MVAYYGWRSLNFFVNSWKLLMVKKEAPFEWKYSQTTLFWREYVNFDPEIGRYTKLYYGFLYITLSVNCTLGVADFLWNKSR